MKILVSERLSQHRYKTPEGYLICTDAILARIGKQTYTKDELFNDSDTTEVEVDRPEKEVFSETALASFENKPVTLDHPDEDVNVGNHRQLAVGYVRDVRKGTYEGQPVMIGDLVITDEDVIKGIEEGDHTDLSCGYNCDIVQVKDGYEQHNIRGNHVALCSQGRAGIARIVDSNSKDAVILSQSKRIRYGKPTQFNKKYYTVGSEDEDDIFDEIKSLSEAKSKVRELKRFDKEEGIKTSYYINECYETDNEVFFNEVFHDSMKDSFDINDYHKYRIEFEYTPKRHSLHEEYEEIKKSETVIATSTYNAYKQLASKYEHISVIAIYKDGSLLKSFKRKYGSIGHGRGTEEEIKSLDSVKDKLSHESVMSIVYENTHDLPHFNLAHELAEKLWNASYKEYDKWDEFKFNDKELNMIWEAAKKDVMNWTNVDRYNSPARYRSAKEINKDIKSLFGRQNPNIHDSKEKKMKDSITYKLTKKRNDYDEYIVQAYKDGKKYEDATYYTDDWEDALNTLKAIAKREQLNFKQQGSTYVADSKMNDELVDLTASQLTVIERSLENIGFKIDKKGKTWLDNVHYQVISKQGNYTKEHLKEFARKLHYLVDWIENNYHAPVTFNVGLQTDGYISAGIDIRQAYVKDSTNNSNNTSKLLNIVKIVKESKKK